MTFCPNNASAESSRTTTATQHSIGPTNIITPLPIHIERKFDRALMVYIRLFPRHYQYFLPRHALKSHIFFLGFAYFALYFQSILPWISFRTHHRSFFPISIGNYLRCAAAAISAPFIDTFYRITRSSRTSFS